MKCPKCNHPGVTEETCPYQYRHVSERAAPAPLDAAAGSAFRLLNDGELIEGTDEFLHEDAETWQQVWDGKDTSAGATWMIGCKFNRGFFLPHRRRVQNDQRQATARK